MDPICDVESYENCFQVKFREKGNLNNGGGQRGIIKGLSKSSRRRLLFLINSLGTMEECFFVTLTMREASENFKEWKRWLNITTTRLRKDYPQLSGIWRLEFQKRGTPHYHLLIFPQTGNGLMELRESIRRYWSNACGKQNTSFQGIQVEKIRNLKKSAFYLSVYSTKDEQDRKDIQTGREWGYINKKNLPIAKYIGTEVQDFHELIWFKRLYRRYIKANGACTSSPLFRSLQSRTNGFRAFMPRPFQRKLFALCKGLQQGDFNRYKFQYYGSSHWNGTFTKIHEKNEIYARKVA